MLKKVIVGLMILLVSSAVFARGTLVVVVQAGCGACETQEQILDNAGIPYSTVDASETRVSMTPTLIITNHGHKTVLVGVHSAGEIERLLR